MTFDNLDFKPRENGIPGVQAITFFENGYGASVIKGYGTYGNDSGLYELAVLKITEDGWDLCYDSGITQDVEGYLSPEAVTIYLRRIKAL